MPNRMSESTSVIRNMGSLPSLWEEKTTDICARLQVLLENRRDWPQCASMQITRVPSVSAVENQLIRMGWERRDIASMLAKKVGIDERTWRRWRSGEVSPTLDAWTRVVDLVIRAQQREKRNGKLLDRGKRAKTEGAGR